MPSLIYLSYPHIPVLQSIYNAHLLKFTPTPRIKLAVKISKFKHKFQDDVNLSSFWIKHLIYFAESNWFSQNM